MSARPSARDDILAAIRAARPLQDPPPADMPAYRRTLDLPRDALATLLAARLADYGVTVTRIPTLSALPATASSLFRQRGLARIVVPPGLPAAWRPAGMIQDDTLSASALDAADGAMTGCRLAIAETGTIMLDGGAASGRRAVTLLPDYHLCVVTADQIVGVLPEAMRALADSVATGPVTFFSGPSATADIELDRVQGVHGPRVLDVIMVGA
jgi:L-lactate dehydrogenase complex protein LldG